MMISATSFLSFIIAGAAGLIVIRTLLSLRPLLGRWWLWLDGLPHDHQTFTIPRCSEDNQENPLHRKAALYLSSLPALEDADSAALLSTGRRPNDLFLRPVCNRPIQDVFLGARLTWTANPDRLLLRLRRRDRRRVLRPYLNHLESVADDIDLRRRDLRLFTTCSSSPRWTAVPFTHPATLDTVAMDADLKSRLRADLESYLKGRAYYHRLGRVWRRSYLLHGPPGTGKSSFVAAMAKFLSYDVYDLDLSGDLRSLLLQTTPRSLILVEDLDRYLAGGAGDRLAGMLNFMDGVFSCCGEERVMVFTIASCGGDGSLNLGVDPAVLRPGRIDVRVQFPMCDFMAFKTLANSYLGLKDHKLYPQVEEGFQSGAALSPAEVGEIMIANQRSPSRALKSVISALQRSYSSSTAAARAAPGPRRIGDSGTLSEPVSGEVCGSGAGLGFGRDVTIREFRKLYGLIRMRSRKEGTMPVEVAAAAAAAAASAGGGGGGGGSHSGNEKDR